MRHGELINRTWTVGEYAFQEVETDWGGKREVLHSIGVRFPSPS